jgi:NACHT domain
MAGTGKSTIARTICHSLRKTRSLGASFFFSKTEGEELRHAGLFVTTLVDQLAHELQPLKAHIVDAHKKIRSVPDLSLSEQWSQLVLQPLASLNKTSPQPHIACIVVDALDECRNDEDVSLIPQLLSKLPVSGAVRLRVLVTSRPERVIRDGFKDLPDTVLESLELHNISPTIVDRDISTFVAHELAAVWDICDFEERTTISRLVANAGGLFLWADLACRFINGDRELTDYRISLILQGDTHLSLEKKIDDVYLKILRHIMINAESEFEKQLKSASFKEVVGSIILLIDPLPVADLSRLLGRKEWKTRLVLESLFSVIEVPTIPEQPARILHVSLRDFLLDVKRCTDKSFWIDEKLSNDMLAKRCLASLDSTLKRNICALQHLDRNISRDEIDSKISRVVLYGCRYWARHLEKGSNDVSIQLEAHGFLQKHLLHWLEVLGLLVEMAEGATALESFRSVDKVSLPITVFVCPPKATLALTASSDQ